MFESSLFLALPLSEELSRSIDAAPQAEAELFIQKAPSPYLEKVVHRGVPYVGKRLPALISAEEFEGTVCHVASLLFKLVPKNSFSLDSLTVIALESSEDLRAHP